MEDHIGLVHHIAKKCLPLCFYNGYLCDSKTHYSELVQMGTIGLHQATMNFDEHRNLSFSTYAYPCIRNSMLKYAKPRKRYIRFVHYNDAIRSEMPSVYGYTSSMEERIDDSFLRDQWQQLQLSHPKLIQSKKKMKRSYYLRYRIQPYL